MYFLKDRSDDGTISLSADESFGVSIIVRSNNPLEIILSSSRVERRSFTVS